MTTCIALFRGINVGGKNPLPMKELVEVLEHCGAHQIKTYIQSGNAVFDYQDNDLTGLAARIAAEISRRRGFEPLVLVLRAEALEKAMAENPFPEAEADPTTLHLGFLAAKPMRPDLEKLRILKAESERFILTDSVFYLHAPEGVGRSRLAASAEKLLGVQLTDRNWKTVAKIMSMVKGQR